MGKVSTVIGLCKNGALLDLARLEIDRLYSSSEIHVMQKQKYMLAKILKYATMHCDYYKKLGIHIEKWEDIYKFPLLSKQIIKNNFKALVSDERSHMYYDLAYTGGSTGEPLEFYNIKGIDGIFQTKLWKRNGYTSGDVILAMDGAKIPDDQIREDKYLYKKNNAQLPYGGVGLSSLYLTEKNIDKYVSEIIELRPAFIRGYPSFIYRIAKYIKDNGIDPQLRIKAIELTSESSMPYQRETIAEAFHTKIIMQYGHTEACAFGYTFDETYRYRIEPLYGFVEVIKEDGSHAQNGEMGEIVVTTLHNYVMPFVRYKTGDYAIFGGTDNQGVILDEILGRTQDYIINRNGDRVLLTALIHAQHFNALGHIERWQLEQFEAGKVIMRISRGIDYSPNDEDEIVALFHSFGNTDISFDYTGDIKLTGRGKSMLLIQHLQD